MGSGVLAAISTELVNISQSENSVKDSMTFSPREKRDAEYERWRQAVKATLTFAAG